MKQLLDKLAQAMNQLDHLDQEAFVGLVSEALEAYPDLGWVLAPDPADNALLRLSLSVRNAPEFRERAAASGLCLLYTSPSPRDQRGSRMPSSA